MDKIPMIQVRNLTMKFGGKTIFENLNLTFEEGSNYAVVGPSGCGKSTLLRIICGLLKPTSGEVLYKGQKITAPHDGIFMMHQTYSNFPWLNALDNVLFPIKLKGKVTEEHIKEAKDILTKVGLGDAIEKYPHEMSGGMKQRLSFARTLMFKPNIILMDEPTSALDEATRLKMDELLLELDKQYHNLIIMVTHNESEARKICDNTIELKGV